MPKHGTVPVRYRSPFSLERPNCTQPCQASSLDSSAPLLAHPPAFSMHGFFYSGRASIRDERVVLPLTVADGAVRP